MQTLYLGIQIPHAYKWGKSLSSSYSKTIVCSGFKRILYMYIKFKLLLTLNSTGITCGIKCKSVLSVHEHKTIT